MQTRYTSDAPSTDLPRRASCATISLIVALTQGLGLNLVSANLPAIEGSLGASAAEGSWLTTAYFATALSSTLLTTKFRLHAGLRHFAVSGLCMALGVNALHLFANDLGSAIAVRAALGLAAAPLTTLAVLYMVEAWPPAHAPVGLVLARIFHQRRVGSLVPRRVVIGI